MLKTKSSIHVRVLLKKLFLKIVVNFIFTSKQIKISAVRSIGTHFRYRHDAVPSRSISAPRNAIKSHRFDILGYLGSNRLSYDGKNRERIREP